MSAMNTSSAPVAAAPAYQGMVFQCSHCRSIFSDVTYMTDSDKANMFLVVREIQNVTLGDELITSTTQPDLGCAYRVIHCNGGALPTNADDGNNGDNGNGSSDGSYNSGNGNGNGKMDDGAHAMSRGGRGEGKESSQRCTQVLGRYYLTTTALLDHWRSQYVLDVR